PAERARLVGVPAPDGHHDRRALAMEFARKHKVHVILKGHRTIVADPSGRAAVNMTGNAGMATAGSGDVLTGMLAAWYAQLQDAAAACRLAVYVHGAAGDLAAADRGQTALVAGDVIAHLGDAVQDLVHPPANGDSR